MHGSGNLWKDALADPGQERVADLFERAGVRIERIVSGGQSAPSEGWYDQPHVEWVVVLAGCAGLRFEDEPAARVLLPGDYVEIAARRRHRVEWTRAGDATVWLAVHCGEAGPAEREK